MKISKILTSLALVCAMGNAMALTATVTRLSSSEPNNYTFNDGANPIATLTLERFGNDQQFLRFSFNESSSRYVTSNLLVNYLSNDVYLGRDNFHWTTGDYSITNWDLDGVNAKFLKATLTYSIASPVPEPESYAMLLAGLGLMGAIARRRNKAAVV
jgi:hypothetical protein